MPWTMPPCMSSWQPPMCSIRPVRHSPSPPLTTQKPTSHVSPVTPVNVSTLPYTNLPGQHKAQAQSLIQMQRQHFFPQLISRTLPPTHPPSFDCTVTDTVVQDNISPIDKVERSTLIVGALVHDAPAAELLQASEYARVAATSPVLFVE